MKLGSSSLSLLALWPFGCAVRRETALSMSEVQFSVQMVDVNVPIYFLNPLVNLEPILQILTEINLEIFQYSVKQQFSLGKVYYIV